jgi:hypothetical protein
MTSAERLTKLNASGLNCKNVATINVGAEDHFTGRTLEEFRADYRALITRVKFLLIDPERITFVFPS